MSPVGSSTASKLTITTWDGNNINDGTTFTAKLAPTPDAGNYRSNAIMTRRVGAFPKYVRQQPVEKTVTLSIKVVNHTLANINNIRKWFDPKYGPKYLVATDSGGTAWRLYGLPESMLARNENANDWYVTIRCESGVWEANVATEDDVAVTASGQTETISNAGNAVTYPTFTLSPNTVMSAANGWTKRRRVILANRSDAALSDPIGDGYPIDIGQDALDTDALNTAGKVQSDLDDLRVWLAGDEIHRWVDPAADNATTKVWTNYQMRGRKTVTNASAMTSNSPANGGTLIVDNASGTAGWPERGAIKWDNELILYDGKGSDGYSFLNVQRGARGTTAAAHNDAITGYWVEHVFHDLLYGYSAASDPAPPNDKKPLIDLDLSTNTKHVWSLPFYDGTRQSRQWQKTFTEDNPLSRYIACYQTGTMKFEDRAPAAGYPQINNIEISCPIPLDAAAGAIEMDRTIPIMLALRTYVTDADGIETLLEAAISQQYSPTAETNKQLTLSALAYRVRLNAKHAVVVGVYETDSGKLQTASVSAEGWIEGQVFNIENIFQADALAVQVSGLSNSEVIDIRALQDSEIPDESTNVPSPASIASEAKTMSGSSGGSQNYVVLYFTDPPQIPTGDIIFAHGYDISGADVYTAYRTIYRAYAAGRRRHKDSTGASWFYQGSNSTCILVISREAEPQADAPHETGEEINLSGIELNYYSSYTPSIFLTPEEDVMLVQARLMNETTGDYIDIEYPMALGAEISIDCENKRVVDSETGWDIPFVAYPSNPAEWISLLPGDNTISLTQVGLVSVQLGWSFRSKKL